MAGRTGRSSKLQDGSLNPFLKKYTRKRKLDKAYFELIEKKFPGLSVCFFCLAHTSGAKFCSEECEYELEVRVSSSVLRSEALERDDYKCQICGVNAFTLTKALKILKKVNKGWWKKKLEELEIPLCRANNKNHRLLDADHIIPVRDGGGAGMCGKMLDNIRSICLLCHFCRNQEDNAKNS